MQERDDPDYRKFSQQKSEAEQAEDIEFARRQAQVMEEIETQELQWVRRTLGLYPMRRHI